MAVLHSYHNAHPKYIRSASYQLPVLILTQITVQGRRDTRQSLAVSVLLTVIILLPSPPQENMLTEMKRTKPSLSIVNPLDVLRQRLLLEIARRQMRENSKQVRRDTEHHTNIVSKAHREED